MKVCFCGKSLEPRPVPGARRFPTRLECSDPEHGYAWAREARTQFSALEHEPLMDRDKRDNNAFDGNSDTKNKEVKSS